MLIEVHKQAERTVNQCKAADCPSKGSKRPTYPPDMPELTLLALV